LLFKVKEVDPGATRIALVKHAGEAMWNWLKSSKPTENKHVLDNEPTEIHSQEASNPKIIVITGMSGSGRKKTAKQLSLDLGIPYIVSYTSRTIRPHEHNGEDYHFISEDEFQAMLDRKEFIQSVHLERGSYGISEIELLQALEVRKAVIVVVNHDGAHAFHKKFGEDALRIFLYVTKDDIRLRLERESAPTGIVEEYLENYAEEVVHKKESEYLLQNFDPDTTLQKIKEFLQNKI